VKDQYIQLAKDIILKNIDTKSVSVFLFGSRANNETGKSADIDIGFISQDKIYPSLFRRLNEELENSRIPYHVDLIDFSKVNADFKNTAMKKIDIWNKGNYFK
jgi:uncharacterized protein